MWMRWTRSDDLHGICEQGKEEVERRRTDGRGRRVYVQTRKILADIDFHTLVFPAPVRLMDRTMHKRRWSRIISGSARKAFFHLRVLVYAVRTGPS